jgi:hypothetical protein
MGGDIGEHEEVAPRMAPASGLDDQVAADPAAKLAHKAAIGIGLQDASSYSRPGAAGDVCPPGWAE